MEAMEIVEGLCDFANRGAGTDAERRAAGWLAHELSRDGHEATVETFWCRPNWALAHALHVAVALVGSLVSLLSPVAGVAILSVALASILADSLLGSSPGRRLTRERASQSVLLTPALGDPDDGERVRLILTSNYDAGRTGLVHRNWLRRPAAVLRQRLSAVTPGWLGWLSVGVIWLLAIAAVRLEGRTSPGIGALQLPPTVALLIALALLVDLAIASWAPAAADNASGVAVAITLARALESMPPQHLDVELVLTGAGDGDQIGLRRYLTRRRGERTAANTVVLGIAACGARRPRWWVSDGPLIPLRYARPLRELAEEIGIDETHMGLAPHKGRGTTPALPARMAGIPALAFGCLDGIGVAPESHQPADIADHVDSAGLDRALQLGLLLVDGIDAAVGELAANRTITPV